MKLIFISAVCGVGKSTTCDYVRNNNLLDNYDIFDIDDLVNISDYNPDTYNNFYEDALKNAMARSKNKNIIIGSCISPTDIEKITILKEFESYKTILLYCSNEELKNRLKSRDENRNCSSDEFIKGQIDYQNYMFNYLYDLKIDNTIISISEVSNRIVNYIKENERISTIK